MKNLLAVGICLLAMSSLYGMEKDYSKIALNTNDIKLIRIEAFVTQKINDLIKQNFGCVAERLEAINKKEVLDNTDYESIESLVKKLVSIVYRDLEAAKSQTIEAVIEFLVEQHLKKVFPRLYANKKRKVQEIIPHRVSSKVARLIEGADVSLTNKFLQATPLINAVKQRNIVLVRSLIHTSDVNERDGNGRTALMHACALGFEDIVDLLLFEGKADSSLTDEDGNSVLFFAAEHGHASLVKMFIEAYGMDVNSVNSRGTPLLVLASFKGHLGVVQELLQHHPKVVAVDALGNNALHAAVSSGNSILVKVLIEAGVPLNTPNNRGQNPLNIALGI